jgi:hypothetical protein
MRNAYKILVGKPEGKKQLGRPRCRGKNNITLNLNEIGHVYLDEIHLAQGGNKWRGIMKTVITLPVSYTAGSFYIILVSILFSGMIVFQAI